MGNDLLSHDPAVAVSSAQTGLTAGFGMGPGDPRRDDHPPTSAVESGLVERYESKRDTTAAPKQAQSWFEMLNVVEVLTLGGQIVRSARTLVRVG